MSTLRIYYSFDALRLGGLAVYATDEVGSYLASLDDGELAHVAVSSAVDHRGKAPERLSLIARLADALTTKLNAVKVGSGDWFVDYHEPDYFAGAFYEISYDGTPDFVIDFRAASAGEGGPRLAAAMGYDASAAIVGDNAPVWSTVRPYYLIIPAALARTKVSPDHYDSGLASDARTDSGRHGQTSVARAAVLKDWTQAGEDETSIGSVLYNGPGTAMQAYKATAAAPWSYQHAWDHALSYQCAILVDDGNPACPPEVVEMRGEGLSFSPTFTGADDFPMYSIEFKTRLLGRVLS